MEKIITSLNVYNFHLFITYLDGNIDIVKFDNIYPQFHKTSVSDLSYTDKISNNSYLTEISFIKNNLIALENSKILKINLQNAFKESVLEDEVSQLSINFESKRLDILTVNNNINSLSIGNENITKSKLIDRKIKIEEKYSVSNMKSYKDNVFLSIRGYGVSELNAYHNIEYRTEDAQDVEFSQKNNIIAVADGIDGVILFEANKIKPFRQIKLSEDICQEIRLFQQDFIIKGKNGLYIYNLSTKKLNRIWNKSVGAFITYYDMIFFSSENKIHMISIYPTSIERFKLSKESSNIIISKLPFKLY